ncbi:hypothetical protein MMC08_005692 [Hypocenomyce scalaris]|nr:hypothetical protein [Hypocenomyce scalaris]
MSLSEHQVHLKQKYIDQRGIWDDNWEAYLKLHPRQFEAYLNIRNVSQRQARLSPKLQEFVYIAVASCATHIHSPAIRAHISAALAVGATRAEIMEVISLTYMVGIHTVTQGVPIILQLIDELGIEGYSGGLVLDEKRQRIKDKFVKGRGFWTPSWEPILQLDPDFFEGYVDLTTLPGETNVLAPKDREILTAAFDAACTHLYNIGTKVHMRNALKLGATPDELMEMLEITSLMGIDGVTASAAVLAGEVEASSSSDGVDRTPTGVMATFHGV